MATHRCDSERPRENPSAVRQTTIPLRRQRGSISPKGLNRNCCNQAISLKTLRGIFSEMRCYGSGRSLQHSDANLTSVEVYVVVNSTLKHQRRRRLFFWKFVSFHPICKIEFRLRTEAFLFIRE